MVLSGVGVQPSVNRKNCRYIAPMLLHTGIYRSGAGTFGVDKITKEG